MIAAAGPIICLLYYNIVHLCVHLERLASYRICQHLLFSWLSTCTITPSNECIPDPRGSFIHGVCRGLGGVSAGLFVSWFDSAKDPSHDHAQGMQLSWLLLEVETPMSTTTSAPTIGPLYNPTIVRHLDSVTNPRIAGIMSWSKIPLKNQMTEVARRIASN